VIADWQYKKIFIKFNEAGAHLTIFFGFIIFYFFWILYFLLFFWI